jgi:hypothetical protein
MILMPVTENPNVLLSFQVLVLVLFQRAMLVDDPSDLMKHRMAVLYEFCSSAKDVVFITTGKYRVVSPTRSEPVTESVEYRLSEAVDFFLEGKKFHRDIEPNSLQPYA